MVSLISFPTWSQSYGCHERVRAELAPSKQLYKLVTRELVPYSLFVLIFLSIYEGSTPAYRGVIP